MFIYSCVLKGPFLFLILYINIYIYIHLYACIYTDICVLAKSLQSYTTLVTLWTIAYQAPLFMRFSRQEYWSGLTCPPPGDLPNPGIKRMSLMSPALPGRFFTTSASWEARTHTHTHTHIYVHTRSVRKRYKH